METLRRVLQTKVGVVLLYCTVILLDLFVRNNIVRESHDFLDLLPTDGPHSDVANINRDIGDQTKRLPTQEEVGGQKFQ